MKSLIGVIAFVERQKEYSDSFFPVGFAIAMMFGGVSMMRSKPAE